MKPDSINPREKAARTRLLLIAACVGLVALGLILLNELYRYNNRIPNIPVPTPVMPQVNAYNDFVQAGQMLQGQAQALAYQKQRSGQATLADYAAVVKEEAPALKVLRQGLNKPYLHPPMRSYKDDPFPQYARCRELARVLHSVAMYYRLSGQPRRAADSLLDGLEMGIMLPKGGNLITGLVANAVQAIASKSLWDVLPLLSAADLAHVAARLERIESKRTPFAGIIMEEGYFHVAASIESMRNPKGLRTLEGAKGVVTSPSGGSSPTPKPWLEIARYMMGNKEAMLRANLNYFKALAAESNQPYGGASRVPVPNNLLAEQALPVLATSRPIFVAYEAELTLLKTTVALRRYKTAHGRYPQRLEQLVPTYLRSVPDDPFGGGKGKPLRYKPLSGGRDFLLYSLGPDLKDNGGTPVRIPGRQGTGDLVAGRLY